MFKERTRSKVMAEKNARELLFRSNSNQSQGAALGPSYIDHSKKSSSIGSKGSSKKKFKSVRESLNKQKKKLLMHSQSFQGDLPPIYHGLQTINHRTVDHPQDQEEPEMTLADIDEYVGLGPQN